MAKAGASRAASAETLSVAEEKHRGATALVDEKHKAGGKDEARTWTRSSPSPRTSSGPRRRTAAIAVGNYYGEDSGDYQPKLSLKLNLWSYLCKLKLSFKMPILSYCPICSFLVPNKPRYYIEWQCPPILRVSQLIYGACMSDFDMIIREMARPLAVLRGSLSSKTSYPIVFNQVLLGGPSSFVRQSQGTLSNSLSSHVKKVCLLQTVAPSGP